jgi:hypothetical protein
MTLTIENPRRSTVAVPDRDTVPGSSDMAWAEEAYNQSPPNRAHLSSSRTPHADVVGFACSARPSHSPCARCLSPSSRPAQRRHRALRTLVTEWPPPRRSGTTTAASGLARWDR